MRTELAAVIFIFSYNFARIFVHYFFQQATYIITGVSNVFFILKLSNFAALIYFSGNTLRFLSDCNIFIDQMKLDHLPCQPC